MTNGIMGSLHPPITLLKRARKWEEVQGGWGGLRNPRPLCVQEAKSSSPPWTFFSPKFLQSDSQSASKSIKSKGKNLASSSINSPGSCHLAETPSVMVNHGASCAAIQSDASASPGVIDLPPRHFATDRLPRAAVRLRAAVASPIFTLFGLFPR